jgi:hypothetical protein
MGFHVSNWGVCKMDVTTSSIELSLWQTYIHVCIY